MKEPKEQEKTCTYFEKVEDARGLLEGIRLAKLIELGQSSLQVAVGTQTDPHRNTLRGADDKNTAMITGRFWGVF